MKRLVVNGALALVVGLGAFVVVTSSWSSTSATYAQTDEVSSDASSSAGPWERRIRRACFDYATSHRTNPNTVILNFCRRHFPPAE